MLDQAHELTGSARIFRDVQVEARIADEGVSDTQQCEAIYAEITDIVQHTVETIRNKPLPDTPTASELIADIERRNRRFLAKSEGDI